MRKVQKMAKESDLESETCDTCQRLCRAYWFSGESNKNTIAQKGLNKTAKSRTEYVTEKRDTGNYSLEGYDEGIRMMDGGCALGWAKRLL